MHHRDSLPQALPLRARHVLQFKKGIGTSADRLGYYQQVLLAFREFVEDEKEYADIKRRWGEALGDFEVTPSE